MTIPTIALIVIACALTVFIIVVLIRLAALIGEAEKTLVIINKRLPAELDAVHALVEHAESSLTELDKLMVSIQEPVEKFRALGNIGTGLIGAGGSVAEFLGGIKGNLPRIIAGFLSGVIASLLGKLFKRGEK